MNKKGISLIVLIIIIIVILILASAVTIGLLRNSPITNANQAKFKQDIAKFQEDLDAYLNGLSIQTSGIFEREYFSATKSGMTYTGEGNVSTVGKNMYNIFGNIKDTEYEDYLYVEDGEMAYDESKLDDFQKVWIKEILGSKEYISKTQSYVGYYADIDGNGTVDGVIYADLAVGNTGDGEYGSNGNGTYTIPQIADTKKYYISKKGYLDDFGTKDVLTAKGDGNKRFYIMALDDISTNRHCWYAAAYNNGGKMSDWNTTTSVDFGKGKQNTATMIKYWNEKKYGEQDYNATHKDMWGEIQGEVAKGWYVPSRAEWAAFAEELGITSSNYSSFGLSNAYWSSSQYNTLSSWDAYIGGGSQGNYNVSNSHCVRLCATF